MNFKLALIQLSVKCGDKAHNLAHAQKMIAEAAAKRGRLIVLPETMDLGWTQPLGYKGRIVSYSGLSGHPNSVFVAAGEYPVSHKDAVWR